MRAFLRSPTPRVIANAPRRSRCTPPSSHYRAQRCSRQSQNRVEALWRCTAAFGMAPRMPGAAVSSTCAWPGSPETDLNELTYLAESGSDRIGALDFQDLPATTPTGEAASLEQLLHAAELIEAGAILPPTRRPPRAMAPPSAAPPQRHSWSMASASSSQSSPPRPTPGPSSAEAAATFLPTVLVSGSRTLRSARSRAGRSCFWSASTAASLDTARRCSPLLRSWAYTRWMLDTPPTPDLADAIRKGPWDDIPRTLRELFT